MSAKMARKPTAVEVWLAAEVLGANALSRIGAGDPEGARSSLTSLGRAGGGCTWSADASKASYRHPEHGAGEITTRRLVAVAALFRTDEKLDRLRAAYRAYVDVAVARGAGLPRHPTDEDWAALHAHQAEYGRVSRALEEATAAWWVVDEAETPEPTLFDLLEVAA